jgi:hypothetical protein
MILLIAIIAGVIASLARAQIRHRKLDPPNLRLIWVVLVAFGLQTVALQFGTDNQVAISLVVSQAILLIFIWVNRHQPGLWLLGLGLALNLVVIVLNGGLMPINPEMVANLLPDASPDAWPIGNRLGSSKDIVLPIVETRLWWLSDRFLLKLPSYRVAYSIGDVLIAAGAFWLLWSMSKPKAHV